MSATAVSLALASLFSPEHVGPWPGVPMRGNAARHRRCSRVVTLFGEQMFTYDGAVKPKDDEKLRSIATATFALVEQTGLSGLTMAAIAREAGLATGTLYVYFKSKEELLVALYEQAKT
ncbi:MAG: helix-turn-helix domain-containing protein, partial [Rhizobacter sp.]